MQLFIRNSRLLLLIIFSLCVSGASAVSLVSGAKYRMVNNSAGTGGVCVGSLHDSKSPLYYVKNAVAEDMFWIFTEEKPGKYSIRNAQTNDYITFDSVYSTWRRYISLTPVMYGDSSLWTVDTQDGGFGITSALIPNHHLNLRTSSMMVGTYYFVVGYPVNSIFNFYDVEGKKLQDESIKSLNVLNYLDTLQFNGVTPVYDNRSKQFILPVSSKLLEEKYYRPIVTYHSSKDLRLYISNSKVVSGGQVNLSQVKGGRQYQLLLRADTGIVASTMMTLTLMPVVEVTGSGFGSNSFTDGTFRVTDADYPTTDSLYEAGFRYRGASNAGKEKKSYAIKLHDSKGEDVECSYHGLRSDNYWILDAMAVDIARMRNPSSFTLWNKFASDSYYMSKQPDAQKASRCFFVELILNGEYAGIYNMMEKTDRKQLQLKKSNIGVNGEQDTIRGVLYKATSWSSACLMTGTGGGYSNNSDTWQGWECKYPDLEDGEDIDWATLYNAVNFVATSSKQTFINELGNYMDLPVWRDFYLFLELAEAYDNIGKNLYLFAYNVQKNKKLSVAPWDMDGTWGREWSSAIGNRQSATYDMDNGAFYINGLFYRLRYWYPNWKEMRAERYRELRRGAFQEDSVKAIFSKTFDLFSVSGADSREVERWNGVNGLYLDFAWERDYVLQWIHDRLTYLDSQYGYDPSGVETLEKENGTMAFGQKGRMVIHAEKECEIRAYDLTGKNVISQSVKPGITNIEAAPGVYLVGKRKILVK